MKRKSCQHLRLLIAALVILSAAICAVAQTRATKQNTREKTDAPAPAQSSSTGEQKPVDTLYVYEFKQPDFLVSRIRIEHNAEGRGRISFQRKGFDNPFEEELELSEAAYARIKALWDALRFLDSNDDYQAEKQFPHLGTVRLEMKQAGRDRSAEFNWTTDANAKALANEYWRAADQAILVFDISVSRENLPLEAPKLMDKLDQLLSRGGLSDPKQLIPLLRELSTDERVPLIARNHAGRILKKIEK
ncbi:MAG: hypothetical protein ICV60_17070 [Pyrinomonadaceae bacterium]|nr:hypothetical protein [Pyrinomonadaceae bacterium]